MKENTNRAIAYNSFVLYVKLAVIIICGLFTTRFALQALGVTDYGLYSVLGGIISFIAIFNTIMVSSSNRFIAVAIGKGNMDEANKQFNVNLTIHVAIALLATLLAYPLGEWYIPRYVNYDGPLSNAMMVFYVSVVGSILSFIGVPYHGLLMAKEKFIVFSFMEVVSHFVKLIVAWILVNHFSQKLLIYTLAMAFFTAIPTLVYFIYCSKHYPNIVKLRRVHDKKMYGSVFNYSVWIAFGAIAQVGKNQGAALVVNTFFNTIMNSAMGIATMVNHYVVMFAKNVTQPMMPQITKSYAAGNRERTDELLVMSTKYSFLLTLMVGSFFLVEPEWILSLWLEKVPPYASIFLVLFIVDSLVMSLNDGVANIIFASGKLGLYQLCVSTLNILSVVLGYLVLRVGTPAYFLTITYICISIIKFFVVQKVLYITLNYDNRTLWKNSYLPSLTTATLFVPIIFFPVKLHPFFNLTISFLYLCFLEWSIGLRKTERQRLSTFIKTKLSKL